jgi:hypothetical protein
VRGRDRLAAVTAAVGHRSRRSLRVLGIEPVANIPAAGGNLQDHLTAMASYTSPLPLPSSKYNHGEVYAALHSERAGPCLASVRQILVVRMVWPSTDRIAPARQPGRAAAVIMEELTRGT